MRRALVTAVVSVLLAAPVAAQDEPVYQVFEETFQGAPELLGYQGDGVVVLDDRSFCAYVLGGAFGGGEYVSTSILRFELQDNGFTRRAVNKSLGANGFKPVADELLIDACVHNLTQFLHPDESFIEAMYPDNPEVTEGAPEPPTWAAQPVMPESLATFLAGQDTTEE
jgi:hypothetical protein